jgi:hypothetical protein
MHRFNAPVFNAPEFITSVSREGSAGIVCKGDHDEWTFTYPLLVVLTVGCPTDTRIRLGVQVGRPVIVDSLNLTQPEHSF